MALSNNPTPVESEEDDEQMPKYMYVYEGFKCKKNGNTIFVGNLPNNISLKELKKLFRNFGIISNARLRSAIRKEIKIPKKLAVIKKDFHSDSNHINAYIQFGNLASCRAALTMNGVLYEGHRLRVDIAGGGKVENDSKKSVFLGNLSFKIQDDDLWAAFEDCGKIKSVRVVRDEKTGIGKGFGYVNFKSTDSVELALKLNGTPILDREVRVSRTMSDTKSSSKRMQKKPTKKNVTPKATTVGTETKNMIKIGHTEKEKKTSVTNKGKNEFQGQKTKRLIRKKIKKKRKLLDKKKMAIRGIAEGMEKKKKLTT